MSSKSEEKHGGEEGDALGPLPTNIGTPARLVRKDSIVPTIGREGTRIVRNLYQGRAIAVFTSGGDSQGMNSAIRSVVRMGIYLGCRVYFIHEGYQGMVDGGQYIVEATWNMVSDIIQKGGTIIGSARCKDFRTVEGRKKAALNLIQHGITNLVCIGGDGTLTGANQFRKDWPDFVKDLQSEGKVTADQAKACAQIQIVGLVGSIDNDFCGTDMTIGTDSALHRIVDAIDAVSATAHSHQRAFVIEVMGRHCGYLALVAALATEADFCFIPEWSPAGDWRDILCQKLSETRAAGQRLNIIVVAEGALDRDGEPITPDQVRKVVEDRLKYDIRVTVLGHVQRGGNPSAFDRLLGVRMGAEAVLALMEMNEKSEACVISIDGNRMVRVPLMQCVERTQKVQAAMNERNFELAVQLRGRSFQHNMSTYRLFHKIHAPKDVEGSDAKQNYNVAVMNVGAPACGMNAAVRSFVRSAIHHHCTVYGIHNSFEGLANGELKPLNWTDVTGWTGQGGSYLGTQKQTPEKLISKCAAMLISYNIHALLIIGGFEAYHSALVLAQNRSQHPGLQIPIAVVPATISNNVPGTSISIGSDTAVNEIVTMIDKIKQSATGVKRRVFVIETMGGYCGYLATLSALASGADAAYIFEEKFTIDDIVNDVKVISEKLRVGVPRYLVIRNEYANKNYTTEFVQQIFEEEGRGEFSTRANVLGHMQQGGAPTPFDRNLATKLASRALDHLVKQIHATVGSDGRPHAANPDTCTLVGLMGRSVEFTPVEVLAQFTDFEHRLPKEQWWLKLRPLLRILSKHSSTYQTQAIDRDSASSDTDGEGVEADF